MNNAKEWKWKGPRTDYNLRPAYYQRALLPHSEYVQPSNVLPALGNKDNANTKCFNDDGYPWVQRFLGESHSNAASSSVSVTVRFVGTRISVTA